MTEDENELVPCVEVYKGVRIHDQQTVDRIALVKSEIDRVLGLNEIADLWDVAKHERWSPESRLLASAKIQALWQIAADERRARPRGLTLDGVIATVAALDSRAWRSPTHFCSDLCRAERAAPRERPLTDECR